MVWNARPVIIDDDFNAVLYLPIASARPRPAQRHAHIAVVKREGAGIVDEIMHHLA